MRPSSLRTRLLISTGVWVLLALVATGATLSLAFRRSALTGFDERLHSLQIAVIAALDVPPNGPANVTRTIPEPRFERAYSGWYWQVTDGEHYLRSRSLWDHVLFIDGSTSGASILGPRREELRVVDREIQFPSRPDPIRVTVAAPRSELRREIAAFDRLLIFALAILGAGLTVAVAVQVGYGLRPLRQMTDELLDVRSGRVQRLGHGYPREIAPLVEAMNDVLDHDQRLIERARAHVGDLAHSLKTPLSILTAETTRASFNQPVVGEQLAAMSRLVDHHLTRAAAAGSHLVPGSRTDVRDVVDQLRSAMLLLHAERDLTLDFQIAHDLHFAGERQDLEEILGNLIDNACKWATKTVVVRGSFDDERIKLEVEDDGPGLDPRITEQALGRGNRLDGATSGSGLGLSIAADLTDLYNGSLILDRAPSGGLRVKLDLPAAQSPG